MGESFGCESEEKKEAGVVSLLQPTVEMEAQAVRNKSVLLINTISRNVMNISAPLFEKELITPDVMGEMALNITNRDKATRIFNSIRILVGIAPSKFPVFIETLRDNDGREAARTLEEEITALHAQGIKVLS